MSTAERGQATVEFALVLPFVALLAGTLIELGVLAVEQARLWAAAREAARAAVVDADPGAARAAARAAGPPGVEVEIRPAPGERTAGGDLVAEVTYRHRGRLPFLGRVFDRTLTASTTMRIERP